MSEPTLLDVARQAILDLTAAAPCWHGPDFDSDDWGNHCGICRALRPLVLAVHEAQRTRDAGEGE